MTMSHTGRKVAETWYEGNDLEVAQQLGARISVADPTPQSRADKAGST